jgi:hypothetical protein
MKPSKLKLDKYRKARGGRSQFLRIACEKCNTLLFEYQKDGPGIIKRLYLDRINDPKHQKLSTVNLKNIPNLVCDKCKQLIGIPIIYKKENRLAYRIFAGSILKLK